MIEITDKRLVNSTRVGDLMNGDTAMYNGTLIQRIQGSTLIGKISERCPLLEVETGKVLYADSEQKVQQVSITIEVHNL